MIGEIIWATGCLLSCASWLGLAREAYRSRPRWGWGCLLAPPLTLLFALCHWDRAWRPCLLLLGGLGLIGLGCLATPPPS